MRALEEQLSRHQLSELKAFDRLALAIWVTEVETSSVVWANAAGLDVWRASSVEELRGRDWHNNTPAVRTILRGLYEQCRYGARVAGRRTFYPKGEPTLMELSSTAYPLAGGEPAVLVEARPAPQTDIPAETERSVVALRYAPAPLAMVSLDGEMLLRNPAFDEQFGLVQSLDGLFPSQRMRRAVLDVTKSNRRAQLTVEVVDKTGESNFFQMQADPGRDPATGASTVVLSFIDTTELAARTRQLELSEAKLKAIVDRVPVLIAGFGRDGINELWNAEASTSLGHVPGELTRGQFESMRALMPEEANDDVRGGYRRYGVRSRGGETRLQLWSEAVHLKNMTLLVGVDVTQRQAERELAAKATKLQQSNRELERYAYVASHDLQEPLRMVSSYTSLLEEEYGHLFDEQGSQYLFFIVDGARRMRQLIADLLSLSRIDATAGQTRIAADSALDAACQALTGRIESSGAQIVRRPLPYVEANPTLLTQVFQNLLGNAIKFAGDAPPYIEVWSETTSSSHGFWVRDHGIGFDQSFQGRIFEMFQRLHGRGEYDGNGIGLAIVKKIIEQHGGSVDAHGVPGQGATFTFTLPNTTPQ